MIAKLNERAEEHYQASIGDYGWAQKYQIQVENAQVALLCIRNHGDGEYSVDAWTRLYTDEFVQLMGAILAEFPSDGALWTDSQWELITQLFHYHFQVSVE